MRRRFAFPEKLRLGLIFGIMIAVGFLAFKNMNLSSAINSAYNGFSAGNIISDYVMSDYASMSEAEIQSFLKSKNPCNDTNIVKASWYPNLAYHIENGHFVCMADESFNGESASHIIWQAAQDYRINPKVLIVLLEKEQGLVTDTWPNSTLQYRSATGYGCPDTAACDSQYYGFKNQVRNAAELFRYILDHGSRYYPVGNNFVKYNPDGNCGGSTVNIENRATSALYQYTPYQPNASVLNSNPGTVVHCGAYGNSNFYFYYTRWFGDTHGKELQGIYLPDGVYQLRTIDDLALSFDGVDNGANTNIALADSGNTLQQFKLTRDGKYYKFQNVRTGKYLGVYNNESDNGTKVELQNSNDGCAQKWLIQNSDNKYRLISACASEANTKSLDVSGAMTGAVGTKVQIWSSNSSNAQRWRLVNLSPATAENGIFSFKTTAGKMLTPSSEQHGAGVNMTIWENTTSATNRFRLDKAEDGSYRIINVKSGLYLAVYSAWTTDGTNAILYYQDDNTCAQRWIAEKIGDGYMFKNSCSNKSLDIDGGAVGTNNRKVQIWSNNASDAQKWILVQPNTMQDISNGTYVIDSVMTDDLRLDVVGGNKYTNGANIQTWSKNGSNNQKFIFSYDANTGYYTISSNLDKNLRLDVAGGSANGNIQLYGANDSCAQQWLLMPAGNNSYYIVSACSRTVIDIAGGDSKSGTNVGLWDNLGSANQKWAISNPGNLVNGPVPDGDYIITSKMNPNLAIDIAGGSVHAGTNVGVWTVHKEKNQQFRLNYDSGSGYYSIYNVSADKNLDIAGAIARNGTNLQTWWKNDACAQKWKIVKTEGEYYRISSACNLNYSLDISGAENRAGANILIWSNHNGNNQQWKFDKL